MPRRRRLLKSIVAFVILLTLGGLIGSLVAQQDRAARDARNWVTHTYLVLAHLDHYTEEVTTAESGARGFTATGVEDFLNHYLEARGPQGLIQHEIDTLRKLTADNALQQKNLDLLQALTDQKMTVLDTGTALSRHSLTEAQAAMRTQRGRLIMEKIRALTGSMAAEEEHLLKLRNANYDVQARRANVATLCLILMIVLVIGIAFIAVQRELMQRQRAEQSLRETMLTQRAILDNSLYAIIVSDLAGVITLFNPASEKITGYSAAEMVGLRTPEILHDTAEVVKRAEVLSDELGETIAPGYDVFVRKPTLFGPDETEWTYIRKDGERITVLLSISALRDAAGNVTGYMGIAQDITQQKQAERMKKEFISTVSHELRTPLTSIRGSLGLVVGNAAGEIAPKVRNLVEIAYKNSERLVRLINDILDVEKIESGQMNFRSERLSVDAVMTQAAQDNEGFAQKYNVIIATDNRAVERFITGDGDRIQQVMANLLSNAIKYSAPGGTVTLAAVATEGGVAFSITDNGAGIPDSFRSQIFGKFRQADSSDTRQKGGTGLGLNLAKSMVEAMKGRIDFVSAPGLTTFTFTLPEAAGRRPSVPVAGASGKSRILICEDDEDIARLLRLLLERESFECVNVYSADEAKRALALSRFDAMTLDLALPGQDGVALFRELRLDPDTATLPVIVISAQAEQGRTDLNGDAVGVIDWLPKPIDFDKLRHALGMISGTGKPRILHVEDDRDLSQVIALSLRDVADIHIAPSLAAAREELKNHRFDLAILDLGMPDGNGLDLLPLLKSQETPVPIIILSGDQPPPDVPSIVIAAMVKSVVSEDKIVQTVKNLIRRKGADA